jgi:hypothetical protein
MADGAQWTFSEHLMGDWKEERERTREGVKMEVSRAGDYRERGMKFQAGGSWKVTCPEATVIQMLLVSPVQFKGRFYERSSP